VRTAHTLHLNLKICAARSGRVCGVATHAVDRGAGYGLLSATQAQGLDDLRQALLETLIMSP